MYPILRTRGKADLGNKGLFPCLIQESLCRRQRTLGIASKSHACPQASCLTGLTDSGDRTLEAKQKNFSTASQDAGKD